MLDFEHERCWIRRVPQPTWLMEIDERANGTQVRLPAGRSLVVRLTESPTAGFTWAMLHGGEPACVLSREEFEPAAGAHGGGGFHRWHFRATTHGSGRIELAYRRAWERNAPPAQVFRVEVCVLSPDEPQSGDERNLPEV